MGQEINLLRHYPKTHRHILERGNQKTDEDRAIARKFGREFFDGDRKFGYGGYYYDPRFWQPVVPDLQRHYTLTPDSSVLDVGCGKGFMLYDLAQIVPGIIVRGVDISEYATTNAINDMKPFVTLGDAKELEFDDASFDIVISINTIHNLDREDCAQSLREIERVSRKGSFITVDAYRNDAEREAMLAWNLTAKTVMHVDEWKKFFAEVGYTGDYYWFIP